jgi:low temperature requirement protein LtrA
VHVVCVFLLGEYLSHHLDLNGFLVFAALFAVIWIAWGDTVFYTSLYVTNDIVHRVVMPLQICTVMVFAAAIPHIGGKGDFYFAVAYGINRGLLAFMYWRTVQNDQKTPLPKEMFRMFVALAVLFVVSAFLPAPYNYIVWAILIIALQLGYLLPKVGVMRHKRFTPRIEHLSERFALLTLIVIGEGFFKMVVTLAEKGIHKVEPAIFVNYVIGGIALFVLCWVYFDFVGHGNFRTTKKHMSRWW